MLVRRVLSDNNSEIDTLISKQLSVENKAKLSQLEILNKQYCEGLVLSFPLIEFALCSTDNRFEISVSISLLLQSLPSLLGEITMPLLNLFQ